MSKLTKKFATAGNVLITLCEYCEGLGFKKNEDATTKELPFKVAYRTCIRCNGEGGSCRLMEDVSESVH